MQENQQKLAPMSPRELNLHHFGTEWKMNVTDFHHLFHINRIEEVRAKIKFPLQPHRKTVFDFILLTEGNSVRSKGLHKYEFGKNTFFFLPAYQISTHEFMSEDAQGYFCHFDSEIFNKLFPHSPFEDDFTFWHFAEDPIIEVAEEMLPPIISILDRLQAEYLSNKSFHTQLIAAYLLALFNELSVIKKSTKIASKNAALRVTERYKDLLSQYIYQTNKVSEYASMLAITPDHLNKCVKATIGKTSQELLADMIILEAKVLLRQTSLSISEIAFKFSETNPSDFSRFFKNKIGLSPKEFRQSLL
ncbi:MAG: helix-turn-helix domain-containing protein [Flectobacillus sp.]|uniref:helix-turn-helix domain-containing protein n=1 Tax=Flectobacillus sp. TaxID=50419 RepID=UPI003B9DC278